MKSSYWSSVTERRLNRRRAMQGALGLGVGAAALSLLGCSGGDGGGGADLPENELVTKPVFNEKPPRGGILTDFAVSDAPTLDPLTTTSFRIYTEGVLFYSVWLKNGIGPVGNRPGPEAITGDVMESWEIAGDGSQVTLKLRPGQKFDPRPPTNGREMTVEDVRWSYERFASSANSAPDVINARNPEAPMESISTPDSRTVVLKLAFPYGGILEALAYTWYLWVLPTEAESKFNPRTETRGTGPFYVSKYEPSVGFEYRRRDDWWQGPERPYLDGINRPIVTEYTQRLAQFRAGTMGYVDIRPDDILPTKRAIPELELSQAAEFTTIAPAFWRFSHMPDSPFEDVRVRRALSMIIDRDLMIDTFGVPESFTQEGLPVVKRWNSHLGNGSPGWIDPQGSEIGEGGKYFQHNIAEAKKLLAAAGREGLTFRVGYPVDEHVANSKYTEVMMAMMQDAGVNAQSHIMAYATDWRQDCQSGGTTKFDGICYSPSNAATVDAFMATRYTPNGRFNTDIKPIPRATDLVLQHRVEFDTKRQLQLQKEIQQILAMEMPAITYPGTALGFQLKWPWLGNLYAFSTGGGSAVAESYYYIDETKRSRQQPRGQATEASA